MRKAILALAAIMVSSPALADGFRAEVHGGWEHMDTANVGSHDAATYGFGLGYDFGLAENLFMGVDANVDDNTSKACAYDVYLTGDRECVKSGIDLSAGLRLGFKTSDDRAKLYALVAYTHAKAGHIYDDGVTEDHINDWGDGWRIGAGYQYSFTANLYGKIEYRYSEYNNDIARHNVIAGVGYQF